LSSSPFCFSVRWCRPISFPPGFGVPLTLTSFPDS
jgi:hypothetical protein